MSKYRELKEISDKNLWYPFAQMQEFVKDELLVIESGDGVYLQDIDGNRYIDGVSSIWTNVHGHNHPKLNKAITDQVQSLSHSTMLGQANDRAIELSHDLLEIVPDNLSRVFYSDNGSTSVEIALKMAYQYFQQAEGVKRSKKKFISYNSAYHGDTIGSVSVGGIDLFHKIYSSLLFDSFKAESPHPYRLDGGMEEELCKEYCLGQLEDLMQNNHDEICALIIEPIVQGACGLIVHPKGYLKGVRELCTKYDILMICDEVAVGFGKTGTMFACQQEDVKPDILCLAKGITGGYLPLSATVTTEEIYNGFLGEVDEYKAFYHGHTFTGNPLACAVAIANIKLFKEEKTLKNVAKNIELFEEYSQRFEELEIVGNIRSRGVMIAIELVKDRRTKTSFEATKRVGHRVILEARKRGVILRPLSDVIVLMPPLSITQEEFTQLLDITFDSILEVSKEC